MLQTRMEKPSQRLHYRVTAPLEISVGGVDYTTVNWSIGGFCIAIEGDLPAAGDILAARVSVPFQGFSIGFDLEAQVLRADPDSGEIAAKFVDLDERARDLLEHFVENIVRGSMTTAEDTIRRIDTPVTPVSTKPDKNPLSEVPARRWPVKRVFMLVFYTLVGLGLFGYIALTFFSIATSLEVKTAVVSAPIETVLASTSGVIVETPVATGEMVGSGEVLMHIQDADLEEAIDRAAIKVMAAEAEVDRAQSDFDLALARFDERRQTAAHEQRLAAIQVSDLKERVVVMTRRLERVDVMRKKGLVPSVVVEKTEMDLSELRAQLDAAEAELALKAEIVRQLDAGHAAAAVTNLDENLFHADERLRQTELGVERTRMELASLEKQRDMIAVRAPSGGSIIQKLKSMGSGVKRSEPIALFQRAEATKIDAYLTHDELLALDTRMPVTVFLPNEDRRFPARIVGVDRESAYVDHGRARYLWRDDEDRTVRITLEADAGIDIGRPGTPAVLAMPKLSLADRMFGGTDTAALRLIGTATAEDRDMTTPDPLSASQNATRPEGETDYRH